MIDKSPGASPRGTRYLFDSNAANLVIEHGACHITLVS